MGTAAQPPFWNRAILKGFFSIMAARRVTSTAVDWVKFADKIPAAQQTAFAAFKNKHSEYLKAVNALPEAPPKIDFAAYANKIAVSGLVEEFQKKYESLEIPYPKENLTATFDQLGAQKKVEYEKFVAASKANIEAHKIDMAKWEAMLPVEQMTCEASQVICSTGSMASHLAMSILWASILALEAATNFSYAAKSILGGASGNAFTALRYSLCLFLKAAN